MIWVLLIPYLIGFGNEHGYVIAFVCMMLALDALFSWSLWHSGGSMGGQAVVFWTLFLAMVGPTAFLRIDLITSVSVSYTHLGRPNGPVPPRPASGCAPR